jgi:hypothetical protein
MRASRYAVQPKGPSRSGCAPVLLVVGLIAAALAVGGVILAISLLSDDRSRSEDDDAAEAPRSQKRLEASSSASVPEATSPSPASPAPPPRPASAPGSGVDFDDAAAASALSAAASRATGCRGGPSGTGSAQVAFGPGGSVLAVFLQPPFRSSPVADCIDQAFRSARVPAYDGNARKEKTGDHRVFLTKSFTVP